MTSLGCCYRWFILPFICFWRILMERSFAEKIYQLTQNPRASSEACCGPTLHTKDSHSLEKTGVTVSTILPSVASLTVDGLYLLALLQKSGRLIDFLQQDIRSFSNDEVGQAARVVHEGCKSVFSQYLTLEPIRSETEGASVVIQTGFNASEVELSGSVQGAPPFEGELLHHGWKVTAVHFPQTTEAYDHRILAPAAIEVRS